MYGFTFFIDSILPYISIPILVLGTIWRLWQWFSVPLPLRIGLAPIPKTQTGIVGRITAEVLLFRTFFDSERAFWFVVWPFHVMILLVLVHHAMGFGQDLFVAYWPQVNLSVYNTVLLVIGFSAWILIALLIYIIFRRFYRGDIRRMSFFSDYFAVFLILAVVVAGTYMTFVTNITAAPGWHDTALNWGIGLLTFHPSPIGNPVFSIHFLFVQALFIYFPFSKLFHPFGQITSRMMTQKEERLNPEGVVVK
jgi:nitrate reductase gamma subunit